MILSIELSQVLKTASREAHRCCTGHSERLCLGGGLPLELREDCNVAMVRIYGFVIGISIDTHHWEIGC